VLVECDLEEVDAIEFFLKNAGVVVCSIGASEKGTHKIIGAIWPILRVLFGVLMEYSTQ
jgi:hypothetical protein